MTKKKKEDDSYKMGRVSKTEFIEKVREFVTKGIDSKVEAIFGKSNRITRISITTEEIMVKVDEDGTKWMRVE